MSSINTIVSPTQTTSESATALSQLSEDYTKFLTLLTAQIQNQDPLSPMDSTQFVSQLAQLSQVEQAVQTNENLEGLSDSIALLTGVTGTDMIGQTVVFGSNLVDYTEEGDGTFYQLLEDAEEVTAYITDTEGNAVRTITGLSGDSSEEIDLEWDGLDDSGQPVEYGEYGVRIEAENADGESIGAYVYRTAEVEEVLFESGNIFYSVSGDEILTADAVLALR